MELHSYAKLRGYKKWTIEQKRKLVEARINYDGIFSSKSSKCLDSWKKIMNAAKLNDFNVCFVRKQWANLLTKYKLYKRKRLRQLGRSGELTDDIVQEISEEWEFFYPLHSFMSRKITNFHSYAQTPRSTDDNENDCIIKELEKKATEDSTKQKVPPNTDHDFYSKSAHHEILDIKIEEDESPSNTAATPFALAEQANILDTNSINLIKEENQVQNNIGTSTKKRKKPKSSERDKYYKHKKRYDCRNERRFDALLNVFGQIVKEHYPNVDTSVLQTQTELVSTEDEAMTSSICSEDSESTCAPPSSATEESGL